MRAVGPAALLGFEDPALERAYGRHVAIERAPYLRRGVAILFVFVVAFALVDGVVFPQIARELWTVRAVVLLLMLPAVPAFTGSDERLARFGRAGLTWLTVVVFGGLVPIGLAIARIATDSQVLMTVPALLFALLALYGASGLRTAVAVPIGLVTVAAWALVLGPGRPLGDPFWIAGGTCALGATIVGVAVCSSLELHGRRDFLRRRALDAELARSRELLRNIVPEDLARRLEEGPGPHVDRVADATVLFATLVGFDDVTRDLSPVDAVSLLDRVVAAFDALAHAHGVDRIKTIGATVLLSAGAPTPHDDPPRALAAVALAMRAEVQRISITEGRELRLRIGMATGWVMAGVIGRTRHAFDVWGDTVNLASRLDTHGEPGRIQLSPATARRLRGFVVEERGPVEIKGKGRLVTSWLVQ